MSKEVKYFTKQRPAELDRIDRRILNLLQDNNQITNQELADKIGLSPPPCLRRVRKLRQEQIIIDDVAIIDPQKVGHSLVFTSVTLEQHREDLLSNFERKMQECDEVMQCYFISGHVDYILLVSVSDMNHYYEFSRKVLASEPNIKTYHSNFCLNRVKFSTKIELDESSASEG